MRETNLNCIQPSEAINEVLKHRDFMNKSDFLKHLFAFKSQKLRNIGISQERNDKKDPSYLAPPEV